MVGGGVGWSGVGWGAVGWSGLAQSAQRDTRARCAGFLPGPPRLKPQSMARPPVAWEVGAGRAVQYLMGCCFWDLPN